ncbi:MAG: protein kinase [Holophaga sp.]|nr:protein kinase [Holophaga sp.]
MNHLLGTQRFSIRRRLGQGTFGVVFEAFDSERRMQVALKLLHDPRAAALYLFKQEFRALADLVHPNLVSPFELLSIGSKWVFTMELVPGVDFLTRLRGELQVPKPPPVPSPVSTASSDASGAGLLANPLEAGRNLSVPPLEAEEFPVSPTLYCAPPSFEPFVPLLVQLASGLRALHQAGLLHRDIKPGNVLVTPDDRVKILDFGLATLAAPGAGDHAFAEPVVGSPAYMAPELLNGQPGTAASDWYAVGVILYQGLTGQMPYTGNPLQMAKFKREFDPCPPSLLVPEVPAHLEQLCMDLLHRDPAARPNGDTVLHRLGQDIPQHHPAPEELLQGLTPHPMGRAREMGILLQSFDRVREGAPRIVQMRGASGLGKTFILRRFLRELHRLEPRALLLSGRCYEQETVPFKALDSLVDALCQHLRQLSTETLESLLPAHTRALARLFPVLQQLPSVAGGVEDGPEPMEFRRRAVQALREILTRLATAQPVVLAIDDLQWGDPDSAALLVELMAPPEAPPLLLLLCSTREPGEPSIFLEALDTAAPFAKNTLILELKELPESEARSLALALLGPDFPDGSQAAERIARESGGNPFFIGEMARQMRAGILGSQGDLGAYLSTHISELPESAQRILQTLAVAACPLPYEPLRNAAEVQAEASHAIALLRAAHLVRPLGGPRRRMLELYHSRVRESLVQSLDPERRRAIHLALALALEASPDSDPETLAIHFEGAGLQGKAAEFAALAGEKAFTALAFDRAAKLFQHSLELRPEGDPAIPRLLVALGNALADAGRSTEAAERFMLAVERAPRSEVSRLRRRAAEEYLSAGHMELGTAVLREILEGVGESYPGSRFQALLSIVFHRLRLKLRGLSFRERAAETIAPEVLEKLDVLWAAAMGLGPIDILRGADFQGRQLLKTLDVGEPYRVVRALAHETIFVAQHGNRSLPATERIVAITLDLAARLAHPESLARGYMAAGIASTLQGRWRAAADFMGQAEALLRNHCTGVFYELHIAQHHQFLAMWVMGRFGEVSRQLPNLLKEARERGDLLATTDLRLSLEVPLKLVEDQGDQARRELAEATADWTTMGFHTQHYHALASLANLELYEDNAKAACQALEDTWPALEASMLLRVQAIAITVWELRARVHLARIFDAPEPASHLAAARKAMRAIEREDTDYGQALVLKLKALEHLGLGEKAAAQTLLVEAGRHFEQCDMTAHAMAMRLARGLLEGASGEALRDGAEAWFQAQGVKNPRRFMAMHLPATPFRN